MRRAELTWFRLGFPRDLDQAAVLAGLASFSGAPHRTRLIFDLAADSQGITHRLAVSPAHADIVTGGLRAAIPSLRLDQIEQPQRHYTQRLLWQLQPLHAVIRADELAAIAAGLLASLFPLAEGEQLRLSWLVRPSLRPVPDIAPEQRRDGQAHALRTKLTMPGLGGYGELLVSASGSARITQLLHRVSAPLWSLSTPHGRLVADAPWWGRAARLLGQRGHYFSVSELAAIVGWPIDSPDLPGLELGAAKRLVPSTALPSSGRILGMSNFAGVERTVAISPAASTRGLYVLGPTGTGKTSLIKNLVRDDLMAGRGLAVVETKGASVN